MTMTKFLLAAALVVAFASPSLADCNRTIKVNGQVIEVVEGLPKGKCLSRQIELRGRNCDTGKARAEPMTPEALKRYPVRRGEDAGYHFVCLRDAS